MVCQDFRCFLGLIGNMGGPWGGPTIGVPGPGTKGGRVSVSVTCSADMVLGHDRSDTSAQETHSIMLYCFTWATWTRSWAECGDSLCCWT